MIPWNQWILDVEDLHSIISNHFIITSMDCNDGRSIQIISFKFIQYFQLLLKMIHRMHNHLMKWIVDLEDLIITIFNIIYIPRITNELS